MVEKVLWDSCVIIDAIQKSDEQYQYLGQMMRNAEVGDLLIAISTASIAEVVYCRQLAAEGVSQDEQDALIEKWMNSDYVFRRNADSGVCEFGAQLAREAAKQSKSLSPIDSIILATALTSGVDALITTDDGKGGKNSGLLEFNEVFGDPPLKILRPGEYVHQGELDLDGPE